MRIFRYEVPVDDRWHEIAMSGFDVLHVAARRPEVVEFWAMTQGLSRPRLFTVVGTGHPIPSGARYWGTALAADGQLVWHLLEAGAS